MRRLCKWWGWESSVISTSSSLKDWTPPTDWRMTEMTMNLRTNGSPLTQVQGQIMFMFTFCFTWRVVGITVLLMNVLIGVLSSNYERYEAQSVGQFFRARVKMLVELQGRPLERIVGHIFQLSKGRAIPLAICTPSWILPHRVFYPVRCLPPFACWLCSWCASRYACFSSAWRGMMYTIFCSLGWFGIWICR